jgi:hypothetical protein
MRLLSRNVKYSHTVLCCYFLHSGNLICNIDWCLFFAVKINHDSHEFILESGTVMNKHEYKDKDKNN